MYSHSEAETVNISSHSEAETVNISQSISIHSSTKSVLHLAKV